MAMIDPYNADAQKPKPPVPGATMPAPGPNGPVAGLQPVSNSAPPVPPVAPPAAAPPPTTIQGAFQSALMSRLTQDPNAVSAQSQEIAPAIQANSLAQQRGVERMRAEAAQGAAMHGTDMSGGAVTGALGLERDRANQEGQFEGQAVQHLAEQRRNEITQALALGGQYLSEQDRMALSKELANLDAQIRREGMSLQSQLGQGDLALRQQLGSGDLALRDKLGSGNLNLGLMGLLQGGDQFSQNLGAQLGMFNSNQNQNALLQLLGGLS